jgi:hypothetical protein
MAEKSWPDPASVPPDEVTDVEFERLMSTLMPNGFRGSPADSPIVFGDSSGQQVKIRANAAGGLRGFGWTAGDTNVPKAIAPNATSNSRLDLVVLRLTRSDWRLRTAVKTGVAAAVPVLPTLTQDLDLAGAGTGVFEMPMAKVTAAAGFSTIGAGDVVSVTQHIAPTRILCKAAQKPAHQQFLEVCETDTGKVYMSDGISKWIEKTADSGWFDGVTNLAGWNADPSVVSRLNGYVTVNFKAIRTGALTTAGTDMCSITTGYRPGGDLRFPVYLFGSPNTYNTALAEVKTTGVVTLAIHFGVQTNTEVHGTFSYPAVI